MGMYVNIVSGPSALDLLAAFAYCYDRRKFTVIFETERGNKLEAKIIGITHESGNNNSFILEAELKRLPSPKANREKDYFPTEFTGQRFRMYYSTKNRKGTVTIEEKTEI